ncbi:MAG: NAD(P)/FAD-dependent oxidoreductase [Anaerolineae bacterium]
MTSWDYDVVIVGAGVAGSASAILLGRAGRRVLLLDRATFPRHKTCGEGIMPEGVAILEELGVLPAVLEQGGFCARGLRFRSRAGVWAQADFPASGSGDPASPALSSVVVRRYELDHLLLEQARATPGVTVREGWAVTGTVERAGAIEGVTGHAVGGAAEPETFRAPLTIGADGMRSLFHGRHGIRRTVRRRQRWGISGHLRGVEERRPYIEVLFGRHSEIYLAPLADDLTLVAILAEKQVMSAFRGDLAGRYHEFLKATPGLGERIRDSEVVPPVGARGPLGFQVEPIVLPGLLLVGDSAGFLDPITGEGMTLALKSARAMVPLVERAFEQGDFGLETLGPYASERANVVRDVGKLTQLMLDVTRVPWLADRAIRRLSRDTELFQKFLGIAAGTRRYADISLRDRLVLALG